MTKEKVTEQIPVWERRLTAWIITGLMVFIASVAVDMKTQMGIIQADFKNVSATVAEHKILFERSDSKSLDHEKRLITLEQIQFIKSREILN